MFPSLTCYFLLNYIKVEPVRHPEEHWGEGLGVPRIKTVIPGLVAGSASPGNLLQM